MLINLNFGQKIILVKNENIISNELDLIFNILITFFHVIPTIN